jgi:hypothetical protein
MATPDKYQQYINKSGEFAQGVNDPYAKQIAPLDYSAYLNRPAHYSSDPNRETAALTGLGQQGIQSYDTLAGLLGVAPEELYTGEQYAPGEWQFQDPQFESAYGTKVNEYKNLATQAKIKEINDAITAIQKRGISLPYGAPEPTDIPSYYVPTEFNINRAYGESGSNVLQTGHSQGGQTISAPVSWKAKQDNAWGSASWDNATWGGDDGDGGDDDGDDDDE